MRQALILSAFALTGCSSGPPPGVSGESTSGAILPDPGALDTSTTKPALPTSGTSTATGGSTTGSGSSTSGPGAPPDSPTGSVPATSSGSTTGSASTTSGDSSGSPDAEIPWAPKPCPAIYAQDLLPTFELEMEPGELKAIKKEWSVADDNDLAEHALKSFKYTDITITTATIRLRGNSSHWPDQGKMQFEVSFNTVDKKGRFMGLKHVLFDAAEYNRSFLRDRLALAIMRDAGLPAPCANNARVVLNGEYYGLYTNIEKVDSEFLERNFEDPDGNLYKRRGSGTGWERKNNEESPDESDIAALKAAENVPELLAVMNLEESLLEWATEAVIPDRDGAWAGGLNLYIYNDPRTGFNVIPWDLDDSFTRLPFDTDPYTYKKPEEVFWGRPFYDIALDDKVWFDKYIAAIDFVLKNAYDVGVLQGRIDTWAAQIATAAAEDPNKPFTTAQHLERIKEKREYVAQRAAFLAPWLKCWQDGGKVHEGKCKPK